VFLITSLLSDWNLGIALRNTARSRGYWKKR